MRATVTPIEVWQQWYSAASEAWSKAIKDISGDEVSPAANLFLRSYLGHTETFRQMAQEYLGAFQPATRQDISHVAGLAEVLEDKVDHLDEAVNTFRSDYAKLISDDILGKVERHLAQVQSSVSEQAPALERRLDQLSRQLGQVEEKLDRMETAVGQLRSALDRLVTAMAQSGEARKSEGKETAAEERKAGTRRGAASDQPAAQA
jgi:uncharacterized protein YukE